MQPLSLSQTSFTKKGRGWNGAICGAPINIAAGCLKYGPAAAPIALLQFATSLSVTCVIYDKEGEITTEFSVVRLYTSIAAGYILWTVHTETTMVSRGR